MREHTGSGIDPEPHEAPFRGHLAHRLANALPPLSGDVSKDSWPERVNSGVDLGFGFDFLKTRRFAGAIDSRQVGAIRTWSVCCEPHAVLRETKHLDENGEAYFLLTLQVAGRKGVRQGNDFAVIRPGEFTVYDSESPLMLDVHKSYRSYNVRIPKSLIPADRHGLFLNLRGQSLSVRDSMADLVWSTIVGVSELAATPTPYATEAARNAVELASLMALSYASSAGGASDFGQGERVQRLEDVKAFMEERLGDSELTLSKVAAANYMSTRTLHNLFEEEGLKAGAWLRARRIEMAQRELRISLHETIATIALKCGFSSVSHFTQAFKQHVGVTPSQYRMRLGA